MTHNYPLPPTPTQGVTADAAKYPLGSFGLGFEVEFLLNTRHANDTNNDIRDFSMSVASAYNAFLAECGRSNYPRMRNAIDEPDDIQYSEWSLDLDITIEVPSEDRAPWGIECISPVFRAHEGSMWRQHIELLWRFMTENYEIATNTSCGTHIHLSRVGGYALSDLKKICESIIHFETAFEAILPEERRSNEYARSNWLDNENFGHRGLSREQSIAAIQRASSIKELVHLMNPNQNKMFGWNFLYLLERPPRSIEFRRGPASSSSQNVLACIELAMSFIEAAVRLGDPESLLKIPSTVGGLKWFIEAARLPHLPGLYDSSYLNHFFDGKNDADFREPKLLEDLSLQCLKKLKNKKEEDKRKTIARAKVIEED